MLVCCVLCVGCCCCVCGWGCLLLLLVVLLHGGGVAAAAALCLFVGARARNGLFLGERDTAGSSMYGWYEGWLAGWLGVGGKVGRHRETEKGRAATGRRSSKQRVGEGDKNWSKEARQGGGERHTAAAPP